MTIKTWSNFVKRKNSTKQPTGGTSVTCVLKETTSVEHPTFVLTSNDFTINYVYAFGEYYFVDDVKSVRNGIIEISCSLDVGATYKSDIGSYTAFVERSATYHNDFLPDPDVAMINDETVTSVVTSTLTVFNPGGFFVISVLNNAGSGNGFTTYYITDISNIEYLAQYVNTNWGSAATDLLDWFQSTFLKTADSVIDCIWVPISFSALSGAPASYENFKIGVDSIPSAHGYRITAPCVLSDSIVVSIPHIYNDFRKGAPYTMGKLFIPGYGMVDFNPLDFAADTITLAFDIDVTTGDTVCYLKDNGGNVVATYTYNIGVSCPVGKVGSNVTQTIGGVLSTAGSVASAIASTGATAVASGVAASASGINTMANAVAPTASIKGGKGGRAIAENGLDVIVTLICKATTDPDDLLATHGRPFMDSGLISAFSGYIKCSGADVPIGGRASDKTAVNDMLNGGFYYE